MGSQAAGMEHSSVLAIADSARKGEHITQLDVKEMWSIGREAVGTPPSTLLNRMEVSTLI